MFSALRLLSRCFTNSILGLGTRSLIYDRDDRFFFGLRLCIKIYTSERSMHAYLEGDGVELFLLEKYI
jgi:hypothetical protein